jgi:PAS domain S-box-containing protein
MEQKDPPLQKNRSFSHFLLLYMIFLVMCIVGFLTVNDYLQTRDNFERELYLLQVQTEQNIQGAMRLRDISWNIYDDSLNDRMKEGLTLVLLEYERSGHNPARMDLERLQRKLGEGFDIYIIDESGVITYTTYTPELGQDFRNVPYFYEYLTKIRVSEGFFPDRIVHELLGSGNFRKYAYMPTPDHEYILELRFAGTSFSFEELNRKLDDQQNIGNIVSVNPYIEQFRIFNSMGRRLDNNSLPEEHVQEYLKEVISTRRTLEVADPGHGRTIRYLFVDLKNEKYGSDLSRIVELTYNTKLTQDALDHLILSHILIGAAAISIGCIIAFVFSRRMNRPIQNIVRDVDAIARGDLDHRIGTTQSREFAVLEQSINMMVDSLRGALQKVKDGEQFQQEMIDQLPVAVFFKRVSDGRYVFWNRTCEQLFDMHSRGVIGKTDRDLFRKEVAETIEKEDREIILNRTKLRNKIVSSTPGGGRIIHMIIVPITDSQGTVQYLLGVSEDVTQENINVKMDLLFSITRRDILEQLSVIMSFLERAQLKSTRESVQTFFDRTTLSVETIKNQIAFMRTLQELGILSPKWQSVRQSFDSAVRLLPAKTVDVRADVGDIEIFADPLLPRVFYNLIDNSLKHGGPKLAVIRFSAQATRDALTLIYEDNGVGIPDDDKEKVFEFGYRAETGFGLYLIREILGFTGIAMKETGVPGRGVRFEILVPKGRFRMPSRA